MVGIGELLGLQSGVIARRQVEAAGEKAADIERRLRRREWVRLLPGVFVDHTGPPTWTQRAWAGVLYYATAVVADESVLVEPPHGLPSSLLQSRNVGHRVRYVDAEYLPYDVEVELDGWFVHGTAEQRRRDLEPPGCLVPSTAGPAKHQMLRSLGKPFTGPGGRGG